RIWRRRSSCWQRSMSTWCWRLAAELVGIVSVASLPAVLGFSLTGLTGLFILAALGLAGIFASPKRIQRLIAYPDRGNEDVKSPLRRGFLLMAGMRSDGMLRTTESGPRAHFSFNGRAF